ncbi:GbsR/MarR family transcriptional regulator [Filobacillus milosensis]|uniref:HTH-type transcriptional regulator n=2 Tax=Filobacillus milosensis TaxID=94137 RepID=A0A4Y8IQQ6_9BACI|nr:GbsR/MarR family transcriptional regulator [Filobacillus milosensis]TFB22794.1 GbsR/MarR family transcriptional regulator [Filobacillus milosensis]
MDSNEKLNQLKEEVYNQIADNMNSYGFPSTIGLVMGIIYYEREPMTLEQLSERTGMSKTRMSQAVRQLIQLNLARKVYGQGSRKDLYTVEQDYYSTFINLFTQNWRQTVQRNEQIKRRMRRELEELLAEDNLTDAEREDAEDLYQETEVSLEFSDWLSRMVDFFESGEIFKYVPKNVKK